MTGRRPPARPLLIRRAELRTGQLTDIRIENDRIAAIGTAVPGDGADLLDAAGGLLLPGLHDHHLHLFALAAAMASVRCGPPDVRTADELAAALSLPGEGWLRGIGYHESVAGLPDRRWLDEIAPARPVRIQHRSGRMWVFNSAGIDQLFAQGSAPPPGFDRATGRLYDEDVWLRRALRSTPPPLDLVGAGLARFGVTGVTEISPSNDDSTVAAIAAEQRRGALPQNAVVAGQLSLSQATDRIAPGPVKLHLHEEHLPAFDDTVALIRAAHDRARAVAVHCVTQVELIFTLAAMRAAGPRRGDRIEHASVADGEAVAQMAALGVIAVVQPNFVAERGDAYRAAIPADQWPSLYRLRSLADAGIPLAGGTDAPFGQPDPWAAMTAAVSRRTRDGEQLGAAEALTPEEALSLFLADPDDLRRERTIEVGAPADLCLLDRPWRDARGSLSSERVRATVIAGRLVHDRVDQPPR